MNARFINRRHTCCIASSDNKATKESEEKRRRRNRTHLYGGFDLNDEHEHHSLIYSDAETERKRDEAWTRGDDAKAKEKRTKVSPKLHWQTLERNTKKKMNVNSYF